MRNGASRAKHPMKDIRSRFVFCMDCDVLFVKPSLLTSGRGDRFLGSLHARPTSSSSVASIGLVVDMRNGSAVRPFSAQDSMYSRSRMISPTYKVSLSLAAMYFDRPTVFTQCLSNAYLHPCALVSYCLHLLDKFLLDDMLTHTLQRR